jgi:Fe2+ transport system protein B
VKSKENLKTMIKIDDEAKMIARDDEVKTIEKTLKEFRARKEKQIDRKIETKASITLPHPFATTFHISILTFTIFICTFNIFIAIFNSLVADLLDHHSQTFTTGDLSDCKLRHLSQQTASTQADTVVKHLQTLIPFDLSKFLETGLRYIIKADPGTLLFLATYSQAESGNLKPSFTMFHSYSTT